MKKSYLLFLPVLLAGFLSTAQASAQALTMGDRPSFGPLNLSKPGVIDKATLVVTYKLTWSEVGGSKKFVDLRTVLVGKLVQYSRNDGLFLNDKVATSQIKKGAKGVKLYSDPVIPYELYVYGNAKDFDFGYRAFFDPYSVWYGETMPKIDWKIGKETETILKQSCTKATANYRGKTLTAWFAESIPTNVGPYLFRGLPGAILKAEIGGLEWEAIGIRKGTEKDEIIKYGRPKDDMSRAKALKFIKEMYEDPVGFFEAMGVECYDSANPDKRLRPGSKSYPLPLLISLEL